jgi:hypothetical protein
MRDEHLYANFARQMTLDQASELAESSKIVAVLVSKRHIVVFAIPGSFHN